MEAGRIGLRDGVGLGFSPAADAATVGHLSPDAQSSCTDGDQIFYTGDGVISSLTSVSPVAGYGCVAGAGNGGLTSPAGSPTGTVSG